MTVVEMKGFCKGNIFKYVDRKDYKGQAERDVVKTKHYTAYQILLDLIIATMEEDPIMTTVNEAMQQLKLEFRYE